MQVLVPPHLFDLHDFEFGEEVFPHRQVSSHLDPTSYNLVDNQFRVTKNVKFGDLQLAGGPKSRNEGLALGFVVCRREVQSEALFKDRPLWAFQNYSSSWPLTVSGSVYEYFPGRGRIDLRCSGQDSDDTAFGLSSLLCVDARQPSSGLTARGENSAIKSAWTCPYESIQCRCHPSQSGVECYVQFVFDKIGIYPGHLVGSPCEDLDIGLKELDELGSLLFLQVRTRLPTLLRPAVLPAWLPSWRSWRGNIVLSPPNPREVSLRLRGQSRPTIALYGEGMSTATNSVTSSWVPARTLRVTDPKGHQRIDRENLVHLPQYSDLSPDPIFKIGGTQPPDHVNNSKGQSSSSSTVCSSSSLSSRQSNLEFGLVSASSAWVFSSSMNSFRLVPSGVLSHGIGFPIVGFVLDPAEEFVDWFFEDHVDPLPRPAFKIDGIVPSLLEESLAPGIGPRTASLHSLGAARATETARTLSPMTVPLRPSSLVSKSSFLFHLALSVSRRSSSVLVLSGVLFRLLVATVLLSVWLYTLTPTVNHQLCQFGELPLQALDGYVLTIYSSREQPTWVLPRGGLGHPLCILYWIAHTSMRTTTFPFVFQPNARLDVLAVPSLDRLWLGTYRYAPTVVSAFYHASHLLSPDIPWKSRQLSSFVQVSNTVIISSSLTSGTSDITKALVQTVPLFATASSSGAEGLRARRSRQLGGDHCPSKDGVPSNVNRTPAQGQPSLLTSNSPSEFPTLVRPGDVIVYFVPLQPLK
ncbi:hypothetical protein Acr_00g0079960 [Actinidia rufa]|uniref:Uncharacterized protein n=1 Tax=Actinidia rufa TaxID=165716 RepID=A0A7J0DUB0_9ERIC|nr:hypothetical protein Acr_00g0079960 [Actinidia rufa]